MTKGRVRKPYRATRGGSFPHRPETLWLDDGRDMQLLKDFEFIDSKRRIWPAAQGARIDGASIPRVFWTIVGGPYEGQYRNASIVHDVACEEKRDPWQDVHRMFYDGCLAGGVHWFKSLLMYAAVYHFGPRWTPTGHTIDPPMNTLEDAIRLTAWVRKVQPQSLNTIDLLTRSNLRATVTRAQLNAEKRRVAARSEREDGPKSGRDPLTDN